MFGRLRLNVLLYRDDIIYNKDSIYKYYALEFRKVDLVLIVDTSLRIPSTIRLAKDIYRAAWVNRVGNRRCKSNVAVVYINRISLRPNSYIY